MCFEHGGVRHESAAGGRGTTFRVYSFPDSFEYSYARPCVEAVQSVAMAFAARGYGIVDSGSFGALAPSACCADRSQGVISAGADLNAVRGRLALECAIALQSLEKWLL
jgi:hypothetical protein